MVTTKTTQTALRLPVTYLERADQLVELLARDPIISGFGQVTRSTVLRVALGLGLDALEEKYPSTKTEDER